jgi:hypothetical protein
VALRHIVTVREVNMVESPQVSDSAEIEFVFERSAFYRVIHVDGAFGGVSPGPMLIRMALYNESLPIPEKITHRMNDVGLGEEILEKREGASSISRQLEADLVMSLETAIGLRVWLDLKISELQKGKEVIATLTNAKEQKIKL